MKKKLLQVFFVPAVLAAMLLSSCGGQSKSDMGVNATSSMASHSPATSTTANDAMGEAEMGEMAEQKDGGGVAGTSSGASEALKNQKIIRNLDYNFETLEYEKSIEAIEAVCSELGGFVENSSQGGRSLGDRNQLRYANYTLRIPQEKLEDFKSNESRIGTVTRSSSSSDNVTRQYYDTESRVKSLRIQEERLLALLEKSGRLADIIELEQALAQVRYEIESLTTSLQHYDDLVSFSTVQISLNEVAEVTAEKAVARTLPDKILRQLSETMEGLGNFGEGLLIFVLGNSPVLLLLGGIGCGIYFLIIRKLKRSAKQITVAPEKKEPPKSE